MTPPSQESESLPTGCGPTEGPKGTHDPGLVLCCTPRKDRTGKQEIKGGRGYPARVSQRLDSSASSGSTGQGDWQCFATTVGFHGDSTCRGAHPSFKNGLGRWILVHVSGTGCSLEFCIRDAPTSRRTNTACRPECTPDGVEVQSPAFFSLLSPTRPNCFAVPTSSRFTSLSAMTKARRTTSSGNSADAQTLSSVPLHAASPSSAGQPPYVGLRV
jgi:hypothetical protein